MVLREVLPIYWIRTKKRRSQRNETKNNLGKYLKVRAFFNKGANTCYLVRLYEKQDVAVDTPLTAKNMFMYPNLQLRHHT